MPSAVAVASMPGARWKRIAKGDRLADLLAALGDKLVVAAHFLAVIAENDGALVDEAEAPHIAVVAGLTMRLESLSSKRSMPTSLTPLPSEPSSRIAVELVSASVSVLCAAVVRSACDQFRAAGVRQGRQDRRN